jgi:hypothetical protein
MEKVNLLFNDSLLVIPSLGQALGYPTLGQYANSPVHQITNDSLLFWSGAEAAVQGPNGLMYFVFGLGYYKVRFQLQNHPYIIDQRDLTGLVLSDFVYDDMAIARRITLEKETDVILNEKIFKVPLNLSDKSETQLSFIQGALMRNLFIPRKDTFIEFMNNIKEPNSYMPQTEGHRIYSTLAENYNKILVSKQVSLTENSKYLESTAGISEICLGADELLESIFTTDEMDQIYEKIAKLKDTFANITFELSYLFSIIQNAALILNDTTPKNHVAQNIGGKPKVRQSILMCADKLGDSFTAWPDTIKRRSLQEVETEISSKPVKGPLYKPKEFTLPQKNVIPEKNTVKLKPIPQNFNIRTQINPNVESRAVPSVPTKSAPEILNYLLDLVQNDYETRAIGDAMEKARDNIRKIALHTSYLFELSKYANLYQKKAAKIGLSALEKREIKEKIQKWLIEASRK